jgi:hypothetical protein
MVDDDVDKHHAAADRRQGDRRAGGARATRRRLERSPDVGEVADPY